MGSDCRGCDLGAARHRRLYDRVPTICRRERSWAVASDASRQLARSWCAVRHDDALGYGLALTIPAGGASGTIQRGLPRGLQRSEIDGTCRQFRAERGTDSLCQLLGAELSQLLLEPGRYSPCGGAPPDFFRKIAPLCSA